MPAAANASSCSAGDNEPWMLAPIKPTKKGFLTPRPLTLVSHQPREPENGLGDERNDRQRHDHRPHERHGVANDRPQRGARDRRDDEEKEPVGWRDQPDHDVEDRHHAKMHEIDAESPGGRNEDRQNYENDSAAFQETAQNQQNDIHPEQEYRWGEVVSSQQAFDR